MIRIHGRNYQKIAENIEERTAEQVAIKIASLSNQRDILPKEDLDIFEILKQGKYKYSKIGQMRWQPEETALMLKLVAKHGNKYFKIEKEMEGKTSYQIFNKVMNIRTYPHRYSDHGEMINHVINLVPGMNPKKKMEYGLSSTDSEEDKQISRDETNNSKLKLD